MMLLKYLLFIHDQYYADQPDAAAESELVDGLRCSERYPAPLPREDYVGGPFPAKDVQVSNLPAGCMPAGGPGTCPPGSSIGVHF